MSITFFNTATLFDSGALALSGAWGAAFATTGGNPYLYVGGSAEGGLSAVKGGLSAFAVSAAGQLANVFGPGGNYHGAPLGGVAGIASFSIGNASYLYATAFTDNAVTGFQLGPLGNMTLTGSYVADADGPQRKLSGAIDAVGVTVGGRSIVIVAGYNENSISSFNVSAASTFLYQSDALTDDGARNLARHDGDDHIIYNKASGALYYDSDGIGGHAQIQFAVLANRPSIAANDFAVR
jgi:hypothetical protein